MAGQVVVGGLQTGFATWAEVVAEAVGRCGEQIGSRTRSVFGGCEYANIRMAYVANAHVAYDARPAESPVPQRSRVR